MDLIFFRLMCVYVLYAHLFVFIALVTYTLNKSYYVQTLEYIHHIMRDLRRIDSIPPLSLKNSNFHLKKVIVVILQFLRII
jgi:hypothetical protein